MKAFALFFLFFVLTAEPLVATPGQPGLSSPLPAAAVTQLRDIKDVIVLPDTTPLWYWFAGGFILLALLTILIRFLKKRTADVPGLQAHEKALKALDSARSLMAPEKARIFAITMADILRNYIEDRFQLPAQNLTTREFLGKLMTRPEDLPQELQQHQQMLNDWLTHCDLVKFARYSLTDDEIQKMFNSVADFITATTPQDTKA